jgi:hypothetical protein
MEVRTLWPRALLALHLVGCSNPVMLRMNDGSDARAYATSRTDEAPSADPDGLRFKPGVCSAEDLRPDGRLLTEGNLLEFLARQQFDVRIERPRSDLIYVTVTGAGTEAPVRLRVAILKSAAEAGRELHEAILQHGPGSWGVHRSNLAVLGPIGSVPDDLTFAAKTKLPCWGMFIVAGRDDTYAVPGGYREL